MGLFPVQIVASLALSLAPNQAPGPEVRDLGPLLEKTIAARQLPGMAAMLITSDQILAEGYAGQHAVDRDDKIEAGSKFHLGSCTKAMTATLAGLFVESGKLAWTTTLAEIFPERADAMHADWRGISLAQLLSHTAGVPANLGAYKGLAAMAFTGLVPVREMRLAVLDRMSPEEPLWKPGSQYLYSNAGYTIAGAMLERIADQSWEQLMQERLFTPLAMDSAGFGAPDGKPGAKRGAGHPTGHTEAGVPRPGADNPAAIGPAGTVHASLRDWAKFVQLHLKGARGEDGLLLKKGTFAGVTDVPVGVAGTYGGGWLHMRRAWSKGEVLSHSGSNTMWYCTVWMAPTEDFAVLVATNIANENAAKACDDVCGKLIERRTAKLAKAAE